MKQRVPPQKILKAPLSAQLGIDETSSDALNEVDAELNSENSAAPRETGGRSQVCRSSVARPLGSEAATPAAAADAASGEGSLATGAQDEGQAKAVIAQLAEPSVEARKNSPAGKTGRDHEVGDSSVAVGPFRILTALVSHPGPTVGYRIEADGGVISYLSDHEPALCLSNGQWPGREWVSGFDLAAETDLLIHDAQYTDEEYDSHVGWGHSSYRHALEFASYVGARKFIAFHHDPDHDDEMLDRLNENMVRGIRPNFAVSDAHEGAVFDIGRSATQ